MLYVRVLGVAAFVLLACSSSSGTTLPECGLGTGSTMCTCVIVHDLPNCQTTEKCCTAITDAWYAQMNDGGMAADPMSCDCGDL